MFLHPGDLDAGDFQSRSRKTDSPLPCGIVILWRKISPGSMALDSEVVPMVKVLRLPLGLSARLGARGFPVPRALPPKYGIS